MREAERMSIRRAKALRSAMTSAETRLWSVLRGGRLNGWRFRRQHPVGPYIADFACVPGALIVEVDGATHGTRSEQERDAVRGAFLSARGFRVLRVWNGDVYENLDSVRAAILNALPPSGPADHLPRERGRKRTSFPACGGGAEHSEAEGRGMAHA